MLCWGRIEATGGFLLLAAALYYLDEGGVLLWAVLAASLHELGHLLAIEAFGGKVRRLRLSAAGAEMVLSAARPMAPLGQLAAALAGPAVNLLLALLAANLAAHMGENAYLFAGLNLSLAAINLLPMEQLDGGRALYWLMALLWSQESAKRVVGVLSRLTAIALLLAGCVVLWLTGTNFTLLVTALWLLAAVFRPGEGG